MISTAGVTFRCSAFRLGVRHLALRPARSHSPSRNNPSQRGPRHCPRPCATPVACDCNAQTPSQVLRHSPFSAQFLLGHLQRPSAGEAAATRRAARAPVPRRLPARARQAAAVRAAPRRRADRGVDLLLRAAWPYLASLDVSKAMLGVFLASFLLVRHHRDARLPLRHVEHLLSAHLRVRHPYRRARRLRARAKRGCAARGARRCRLRQRHHVCVPRAPHARRAATRAHPPLSVPVGAAVRPLRRAASRGPWLLQTPSASPSLTTSTSTRPRNAPSRPPLATAPATARGRVDSGDGHCGERVLLSLDERGRGLLRDTFISRRLPSDSAQSRSKCDCSVHA